MKGKQRGAGGAGGAGEAGGAGGAGGSRGSRGEKKGKSYALLTRSRSRFPNVILILQPCVLCSLLRAPC
jgi:hypothetical protein